MKNLTLRGIQVMLYDAFPMVKPIWYLGCLVGIDLRSEAMLYPLLLSIKCKLLYWDAQQLSFAGQVVVAN